MKKKSTLVMTCALCAAMMLSGCGDKEAVDSNKTPDTTPPVVEDQITIPEDSTTDTTTPTPDVKPEDNIETPTPDEQEHPVTDETPVAMQTTTYVFPNTKIELTVPDSWIGKYYVEEIDDGKDIYPSVKFHYLGDESDKFDFPLTMMFLNVDNKQTLIDTYGENFLEAINPTAISLGEYLVPNDSGEFDTYVVIQSWVDAENTTATMPEDYTQMVSESQDPMNIYCYIPAPVIVDEAAKPFVEAIEAARSEEDNMYIPLVANMAQDAFYLEAMQLNASDVEAFAIGLPMMNVSAYNVSIIKPAEGKGDAVKAGLEKYVENTVQSFENYLIDQLEIAKGAIIEEVNGAYVLVMCENAQQVFDSIKASLTA